MIGKFINKYFKMLLRTPLERRLFKILQNIDNRIFRGWEGTYVELKDRPGIQCNPWFHFKCVEETKKILEELKEECE